MLVSIITVHLNDFAGLRLTLDSLERLEPGNWLEWIIVDGGSTSASAVDEETRRRAFERANTVISEPDGGIYDAMNKGVAYAKGKYLLFLNAGDGMYPAFNQERLKLKLPDSAVDMIWGKTSTQYPDGSFGVKKLRGPRWAWYGMPVCHQSVFFLRERFGTLKYDTSLAVAADYDLISQELAKGATVHLVDDVISIHAAGGASQQNKISSFHEESLVRARHYGLPLWLSRLLSTFRHQLWKLSDASPSFNRFWRKWV